MRRIFMIILGVILLLTVCWAGDQVPLGDQKAKDSYSLGYQFGASTKRQPVDLDIEVIVSGIRDAYEGKEPRLSTEEMKETLGNLKKKVWVAQQKRYQEQASRNLREGEVFLAENTKKEGVITLPSGLQYKVLKEGDGPTPKPTDKVTINYHGTLIDGTEFDSSYARGKPETVRAIGVIEGWREALQLMKVGSKWQIFVPPKLGYGERQFGRIPPNSVLVFDMELLSIEHTAGHEPTEPEAVTDAPAVELPANEGGRSQAGE
jgi:FKBP-type peptidyl-prolyl cis-trans isomerase FklB